MCVILGLVLVLVLVLELELFVFVLEDVLELDHGEGWMDGWLVGWMAGWLIRYGTLLYSTVLLAIAMAVVNKFDVLVSV